VKFFQKVVDRLGSGAYTVFIDGGAATDFAACGRFFVYLMKGVGSTSVLVGGRIVFAFWSFALGWRG